ncbi:MAG: M42 family metallopeptidase [Candidatus Hodarchaeota archaeon]
MENFIEDDLLNCLNIPGQSGFEGPIRNYIEKKLNVFGQISRDRLGSVICEIKGDSSQGIKIFISAHMDTCGFLVHSIESNGKIKCINFGYRNVEACHLQPVAISTKDGYISGLLNAVKEGDKLSFTIDIGIRSMVQTTDMGILAGDPIHFINAPVLLGVPSNRIICSPRLDNRFGIFELLLLAETFQKAPPMNDIYLVATVEEEVGARGAKTAASMVKPDLALILDATYDEHPVSMGKGPVITLSDRSVLLSSDIRNYLLKLAKNENIPIQTECWNIGGSDAGTVRVVGDGIPTVPLLTATKNAHTPSEIGCIKDCYTVVKFCQEITKHPDQLLDVFQT